MVLSNQTKKNKGLFQDPEVGTEAHDAIQEWLMNPENAAKVIWNLKDSIDETKVYYSKTPEELELLNDLDALLDSMQIQIEKPVKTQKEFLYGFADAVIFANFRSYLIEIKTGKISLGEITRQIKLYKENIDYGRSMPILLHTQEMTRSTYLAFESQGITCYHLTKKDDEDQIDYDFALHHKDITARPVYPHIIIQGYRRTIKYLSESELEKTKNTEIAPSWEESLIAKFPILQNCEVIKETPENTITLFFKDSDNFREIKYIQDTICRYMCEELGIRKDLIFQCDTGISKEKAPFAEEPLPADFWGN